MEFSEILKILATEGIKTVISMFSQGKIKREDFELAILTHICTCLENMSNKLDALSNGLKYIKDTLDSMSGKFDVLSNKPDIISGKLDSLSSELKSIKDTLNFMSNHVERIEKILHNINDNIVITYEQTVTILRKLMRITTE